MRNKNSLIKFLTWLAWGLILFDLALIFLIPTEISSDSLLWPIAYLTWLVITLLMATTWLIIRHRRLFRSWLVWLMTIAISGFSSLVVQSILSVEQPNLSFFFSLLFIIGLWCSMVATAILVYYRDVGLSLIGWGSVVFIWALVVGWRFQGSLIELWVGTLNNPEAPSPLWWLNNLLCFVWWIVPLSIISFLGHTLKLIIHECR